MRRFCGDALGQKLKHLLELPKHTRPTVMLYTAADDRSYPNCTIVDAWPLPFNGRRVTIVAEGPNGILELTWNKERRNAQLGETPLSAIEVDSQ